jgi:hypothetical protein
LHLLGGVADRFSESLQERCGNFHGLWAFPGYR